MRAVALERTDRADARPPNAMFPQSVTSVVSSILQNREGEIIPELIGERGIEQDLGSFTVLYQRGLLHNPCKLERNQRKILSKFKIVNAGVAANVPWRNMGYYSEKKEDEFLPRFSVDGEERNAVAAFRNVEERHIKVIWQHSKRSFLRFRWYVAFEDDAGILTPVPKMVSDVMLWSLRGHTDKCTCGQCVHPLTRMAPSDNARPTRQNEFDAVCVKTFSEFRKMVERRSELKQPPAPPSLKTKLDTCSICLDEGVPCVSNCAHERCTLAVCTACREKTRGLCPLCDRAKMSPAVGFHCHSCHEAVALSKFGHACFKCGEPQVCSDCFQTYGVCGECESDTASNPRKRRR